MHPGAGAGESAGTDAAYRALGSQLIAQAIDQVQSWQRATQPRLDAQWQAVGGVSNTAGLASATELEQVLEASEKLLAPYVRRRERRAPIRGSATSGWCASRSRQLLRRAPRDECPAGAIRLAAWQSAVRGLLERWRNLPSVGYRC
jgi:hypothetical protein